MSGSVVADYRTVLGIVDAQVAGITAAELAEPTPCAEWTAGELCGHLVGATRYYALLVREGHTHVQQVAIDPTDDVPAMVADEGRAALATWTEPGALEREVTMVLGPMTAADALRIHVADLAVHAWDVASARHRRLDLPADLAARALGTWTRVLRGHDLRGIVFGDDVALAPASTPTDRLVAFCGRDPRWA